MLYLESSAAFVFCALVFSWWVVSRVLASSSSVRRRGWGMRHRGSSALRRCTGNEFPTDCTRRTRSPQNRRGGDRSASAQSGVQFPRVGRTDREPTERSHPLPSHHRGTLLNPADGETCGDVRNRTRYSGTRSAAAFVNRCRRKSDRTPRSTGHGIVCFPCRSTPNANRAGKGRNAAWHTTA